MSNFGTNEKFEKEIMMKDMMFFVLLKWRSLLVWSILFSILLGGYSHYSAYKNYDNYINSTNNNITDIQLQVVQIEKEIDATENRSINELVNSWTEDKIIEYKKIQEYDSFIKRQKDYIEDSLLMKIDPNQTYNIVLDYYLKKNNEVSAPDNDLDNILACYQSMNINNELNEAIAEAIDTEPEYVDELVNCDIKASVFTFTMKLDSEENAKKAVIVIKELMNLYYDEISKNIGKHELLQAKEKIYTSVDKELSERQIDEVNILTYNENQRIKVYSNLNKETLLYYQYLTEVLNGDEALSAMRKTRIEELKQHLNDLNISENINVKYVILGFTLGLLLSTFIYFLIYILGNRLNTYKDLELYYSIPLLGIMYYNGRKKRLLYFIDMWLVKLRNRNNFIDKEDTFKIIISKLRHLVKKHGVQSVFITGSYMGDYEMSLASEIQNKLRELNIETVVRKDMIGDYEIIETLDDNEVVMLIETIGKSLYTDISREIYYCHKNNIMIMGSIVVDEV